VGAEQGNYFSNPQPLCICIVDMASMTRSIISIHCKRDYCSYICLSKKIPQSLTLKEAEKLLLSTLRQVMEEKLTSINVEVCAITTADRKFRIYSNKEVEDIMETLEPFEGTQFDSESSSEDED